MQSEFLPLELTCSIYKMMFSSCLFLFICPLVRSWYVSDEKGNSNTQFLVLLDPKLLRKYKQESSTSDVRRSKYAGRKRRVERNLFRLRKHVLGKYSFPTSLFSPHIQDKQMSSAYIIEISLISLIMWHRIPEEFVSLHRKLFIRFFQISYLLELPRRWEFLNTCKSLSKWKNIDQVENHMHLNNPG
jgi:hypothetical protein